MGLGLIIPVITNTGGIGSGKSTVREIFEELGAVGIDADDLARQLVEPGTTGLRRVEDVFGKAFFTRDGRLNRKKLAEQVFNDTASRMKLESILHPLIREEETLLVNQVLEKTPDKVVVVEVPLLVEGGRSSAYDGTVLVAAAREIRLHRLVNSGEYTREEAAARMKSQATEKDRARIANWKVDNNGSIAETQRQVEKIYHDLYQPEKTGGNGRKNQHGA